ncbi:MAG: GerMN domain-containing protein [Acidimicrobiia bacterium]|nr:GerMN domain-containing protein [Acidimicrobiia bacterium]
MTAVRAAIGVALLALLAWAVTQGLEWLIRPRTPGTQATAGGATADPGVPHITATLFYGAPDGTGLVGVRREVPLAEGVVPQGRAILTAQLEPAPEGHVSVIPQGTTLRAFYVTPQGDAFVDLNGDASAKHPGGSFTELLTVHAIVNAVTANLPSIQRVQILIDGREADTLAGHVDLRRPLPRDTSLVRAAQDGQ